MIGAALAERGAEADFQVIHLDLDGAALAGVHFGSETRPDAAIPLVEARWRWRGLVPQLYFLRLVRPELRVRVDGSGRMSAGALDRISGGPPGLRRPILPEIELEILEGRVLIDAPFGQLTADLSAAGEIGRNFSAAARLQRTSRPGENYALVGGEGELVMISRDERISLRFDGSAETLVWAGARIDDVAVRIGAAAPLDLARYDVEAAWRAASLRSGETSASSVLGAARMQAEAQEVALAPQRWAGRAYASAGDLRQGEMHAMRVRLDAYARGVEARGDGRWTLTADRFAGLAMLSEQPSAEGGFQFELEGNETMSGAARVSLARTRLDAEAQRKLRQAFPDLGGAPVGPTLESAERALDAAADRFDLIAPIMIEADESGVRLRVERAAEARAATGAVLRLQPLRQDAPALVLQWPGPTLRGAVELDLDGGGAPHATLLLDTLTWSNEAPFEADGTLTLADWRAEGASIAANELGVGITLGDGRGRVDLRGPARVTGPLGQGEVRGLVADLDVAVQWDRGWRVTSNRGCLPVRLDGLDAAGLSFAGGAFRLCPLEGALIAADAGGNLAGGFFIRQLALNGRMAGPQAQPARLGASGVSGRFRGRTGDMTLALEALSPSLTIAMDGERTFALSMARITADARFAGERWSVAGGFQSGSLTDPALPGSVSAIAGRWSAAPVDGEAVVQVEAGEALLTSNRPDSMDERPLFKPLRLAGVSGVFRDGRVDAEGAVMLDADGRQLARFAAFHEIDPGIGAARVVGDNISFSDELQPYDITERARGVVENVRGDIDVIADISWDRDSMVSNGTISLNGVSLATATIPVVENVRGDVYFDDLFALTTPPGQDISVGRLNVGVNVTDGQVFFQLLPEQQVAIENAFFTFARGTVAMRPTTITLGADETSFEIAVRDIDAAALLATLNVPDLNATGRLEGSFPLRLTRRSAYVEDGVLRAQPGGGNIAYTGEFGEDATGATGMAFDALRGFHYDNLALTLDGDLNGEVVSSIQFSGENTGRPVDLGPVAPGLGDVEVRGVPFRFNVRITAPFRRLADTAATIVDPGAILRRNRNDPDEEPVDQAPEPPR